MNTAARLIISFFALQLCIFDTLPGQSHALSVGATIRREGTVVATLGYEWAMSQRFALNPEIGWGIHLESGIPIRPSAGHTRHLSTLVRLKYFLAFYGRQPHEGLYVYWHCGYFRSNRRLGPGVDHTYRLRLLDFGPGFGGQWFFSNRLFLGANFAFAGRMSWQEQCDPVTVDCRNTRLVNFGLVTSVSVGISIF